MQNKFEKTATALLLAFTAGCTALPAPVTQTPAQPQTAPVAEGKPNTCKNLTNVINSQVSSRTQLFAMIQAMPQNDQKDLLLEMNTENTTLLMDFANLTIGYQCPPEAALSFSKMTDQVMDYSRKFGFIPD
jgi:hypothetical protein